MILRLSWRLLPTVDLSRKLYDEKQALLNQMSIAD